jgi:hypothetical protein
MSAYQTGFDVGLPTDNRGSKSGGCFRKSISFAATAATLFSAIALALVVYVGFYMEDTASSDPVVIRVGIASPLPGYISTRSLFAGTGSWTTKASLAAGTSDFVAVTVGDKIYMVGGATSAGNSTSAVTEYDPVVDKFDTNKTSASAGRMRYAASVVGTKIYVIGGVGTYDDDNSDTKKTTWVYDTVTDAWAVGPELITSRSDFCAFTVGTKIYAVGGYTAYWVTLASVEVLDTAATAPAWTTAPALPAPRGDVTCAASSGKGYAIGGFYDPTASATSFDHTAFVATMYELDVASAAKAWVAKSEMPTAIGDKAAAVLSDGSILVIGGETHNRNASTLVATHTSVQYYPKHDTWVTKAPIPTARFRFAAATDADGFVHAFGGHNSEAAVTLNSHEVMMDVTHPDLWIHSVAEL